MTGASTVTPSRTPPVEPGRLHTNEDPIVPATARDRIVVGTSFVCNLPGSTGGVRDGVTVLAPVIGHLVAQLRGGDH